MTTSHRNRLEYTCDVLLFASPDGVLRSVADGGRQGRIPMGTRVPRIVKEALFWLLDKVWADRLLAPPINSFRGSVGLPAVQRILGDYAHSPDMVLGLFPDWFATVQPDWPRNLHLTGFVLHDDSERQSVTPEVEDFLAVGPPPVVVTPGSAAATLRDFFRESVEACRIGGFRAMLVTRYPEQLPGDLPPPECGTLLICRLVKYCRTARRSCIQEALARWHRRSKREFLIWSSLMHTINLIMLIA